MWRVVRRSQSGLLLSRLAVALALLLALDAVGWAAPPDPPQSEAPAEMAALEPRLYLPFIAYTEQVGAPYANCRYGITVFDGQHAFFDIVENLNAGWYLSFNVAWTPPGPSQSEFVQMVRLSQGRTLRSGTDVCGPNYGYEITPPLTDAGLGALVDHNPGALWIVGNEPDRLGQDDVCPQQYARAYHDVYQFIKGRDPTARIAVAGLVEVTPGRLQYLDIVWNTYRQLYGTSMPVDVWTMHIYILSETGGGDAHIALGTDPALAIPFSFNCSDPNSYCHAEHDDMNLFIQQVEMMRQWMKDHDYRDRPLLITEYGILKPYDYYGTCTVERCPPQGLEGCFCDENGETFHPRRVAEFMEATFDYLSTARSATLGYPDDDNRLVQQWLWYSLVAATEAGKASDLADPDNAYALTLVGQRWQSYVRNLPPNYDLYPSRVASSVVRSGGTPPVTATLTVWIANEGDAFLSSVSRVTFYRDAALSDPIGSALVSGISGCRMREVAVTVQWPGLSPGMHEFWVEVDSEGWIQELDETNNVGRGVVLVDPFSVYLPLVTQ